ncbi:MAG: hypothetical protein M3Q60_20410 [Actinomycetota bacterium]|nr:hypothetical protein [Actinomycetota bacterium]
MASIAAALFAFGAMALPLYWRLRDSRTHLRITYSVGKPEHPADINDIPEKLRTHEPALWITVLTEAR